MLAKVNSCTLLGLEAITITVEADIARGLPSSIIVGLPDSAVKESKERVRAAIKNSGFSFPSGRITINLSPADVKKEGPSFDLAIALGILAAAKKIDASTLKRFLILGELSLDGGIRPVRGAFPIAASIDRTTFDGLILPQANAAEAALADNIAIYPAKDLNQVVHFLQDSGTRKPFRINAQKIFRVEPCYDLDFSDVKGQTHVKRALEVAAAGGHNILLIGIPGSGKTMMAKRLSTILPALTKAEAIETVKIHSIAGLLSGNMTGAGLRPFRSPHHTASDVALVGGGTIPRPGEVSLAHNGVLFLDELPEFSRDVLEALRQPLEDHCVHVSRAHRSSKFPARFMLVAAMNPCPCGWATDPTRECHCSPAKVQKYLSRISGPLLDRIDIHVEVPSLKSQELLSSVSAETSQEIRRRTTAARAIQQKRFARLPATIFSNAQMTQRAIKEFCGLDAEAQGLLKAAMDELHFSARAHDKILKVARTIADLDGKNDIGPEHVAEAVQYRSLDRDVWA